MAFYIRGLMAIITEWLKCDCNDSIDHVIAVAFKHFGMDKVMICDRSVFRLKLAENLGFATCNPFSEDFEVKARDFFGTAYSLSGATANIDCWLDAAGAGSILNDFLHLGKIESRFVSVGETR